jgi:aspartyl-tRNA(Asn)/glutamyl-tRNA(Gln) amidotransferase subunit C
MDISKEVVKYIAHLARIELKDQELQTLTHQLLDILAYMEKLKKLDVSNISPTSHVLTLSNVYRQDKQAPSLPVSSVLANAPKKRETSFSVPKVIT